MSEIKDDSSSGIAQRLEQLNQWQEEQKKILFDRQNKQRKLLGLEHRKMYETLGIFHADLSLLDDDETSEQSNESEASLGVNTLDQTADGEVETVQESETRKPKRPFLRRKQGLINRFKVDPDQFRLSNLPPYKFSSSHPSLMENRTKKVQKKPAKNEMRPISRAVLRLKPNDNSNKVPSIDAMEEKFQKSLISSQTACNSTPDTKTLGSSTKQTPDPISWAKILDPQNIKPIEQHTILSNSSYQDESDNMSVFELLEKKAQEGSFDINSSCIKRFLRKNKKQSDDETLESPITVKLPPVPYEVYSSSKSLVSDSTDCEVEETLNESPPKVTTRVRFAETPQTNKAQPSLSEVFDTSDASQVFEEFKKMLFANQSDATIATDNVEANDFAQEILQKADLVRTRLAELESEISTFKQTNLELVKSKQEHEMEKAHFEQERIETLEKLNDERIQMEIYLHDERMKIEQDRKKMEKQIRSQKSLVSGKEKKEIARLQEEIQALQKEMKRKEESHVAAQSRLRAQVRNLEKDVRQLNIEMEVINKENKRLEAENAKINRQNNNKMLQEINRNIAKLAPKGAPVAYMEETPKPKTTTDPKQHGRKKSISHRRSSEVKRKPSPIRRQSIAVHSSDEEFSSRSSNESSHRQTKVTFAKSSTPPSERTSTENIEPHESPPISVESSFKREIRNPDGSKDIWYPNGNLKKISADGMIIRMLYFNKDIKETNINEGTVKYYYAETNTWHTTYLDGLEILEFPNGQTEHRYKDGKIEVHFPNNSIKITDPLDESKLEEWRFADGTNLIQMKNGDKILLLSNGQKEIHTAQSKRREYPDGTVKLVYPDGSQETRYSNGRVRLKDKDGNLIMDSESAKY